MTKLEIEAFIEIVQTGSISAAAKSLYVSQPALSRRIHTLEAELGYALLERNKGRRAVVLTEKGDAFIRIANQWMHLWQDAQEINHLNRNHILHISSVGSVSTYILPAVFHCFSKTNPDVRICFHNYHSLEAYQAINQGTIEMAFISDDMFHKSVETIPVFKEPMVLVANASRHYKPTVHPSELNPENEIRLPWFPEFDSWHDFWFKPFSTYQMFLDQMSLLEDFLLWKDTWAIVPASVAQNLLKREYVKEYKLCEVPPDRIIYYLKRRTEGAKSQIISEFLNVLGEELQEIPEITSFI